MLWYNVAPDPTILKFATSMGDRLVTAFGGDPQKLYDCAAWEENDALLHGMALLYALTGTKAYSELCDTILLEFQMPPCGDYVRNALAGKQFWQGSQPRWEGLHAVCGIAQMYWNTGKQDYSTAYQQIWWSLCQYERHNHGGIMSQEQASGSPYNTGSIETCCTVAWTAMTVELLKLTGLSVVADEVRTYIARPPPPRLSF
jgi:DUF1680 family protein